MYDNELKKAVAKKENWVENLNECGVDLYAFEPDCNNECPTDDALKEEPVPVQVAKIDQETQIEVAKINSSGLCNPCTQTYQQFLDKNPNRLIKFDKLSLLVNGTPIVISWQDILDLEDYWTFEQLERNNDITQTLIKKLLNR